MPRANGDWGWFAAVIPYLVWICSRHQSLVKPLISAILLDFLS